MEDWSTIPILDYQPDGGVPVGPVSNPPVYSQAGTTQLIEGQAYIDVVFGSVQTTDEWVLVECIVVNELDVDPLNIWPGIITDKAAAGFRIQLNGLPDSGNYYLHWAVSGVNITPSAASTYYLVGPATGGIHVDSTAFTVSLPPSTTVPGAITITPDDGGLGGSFTPASVTLTSSSRTATFTYTPTIYGAAAIGVTNSGGLIDPASIAFTCVATGYALTGPSSGSIGVVSTDFTLELPTDSVVIGTVTVTPDDGGDGGTFIPTTVALTTGAPSATFTYTPASSGTKTINVTNNGGLTDPSDIVYMVAAPFVPTDIAGLKLWLKADALALTDGAAVSTWTDSSGNSYSFSTFVIAPIYKTNILNSKPVVRFNGVTQGLNNATNPIIPADTTAYTIFAVARATTISAAEHTIFTSGTATVNQATILRRDGANLSDYQLGTGYASVIDTSGIVADAWNYITADWNGTNMHLWRNGTLKGTTGVTLITSAGNETSIGFNSIIGGLGNAFWDGDIAEVLVYNSSLSGTDRGNVESYLANKYAL